VAMLLFGWISGIQGIQWLYLITYAPFIMHLIRVSRTDKDEDLDPELKKLALSTFFMALVFLISSFY
jgi:1,4-dihydroxy-2-naphthoate octaprenyltransferase